MLAKVPRLKLSDAEFEVVEDTKDYGTYTVAAAAADYYRQRRCRYRHNTFNNRWYMRLVCRISDALH
jgi:5-hydroxyisourate hydrolase-like protein (transthyretin family)